MPTIYGTFFLGRLLAVLAGEAGGGAREQGRTLPLYNLTYNGFLDTLGFCLQGYRNLST
jgi:hypothetical protein